DVKEHEGPPRSAKELPTSPGPFRVFPHRGQAHHGQRHGHAATVAHAFFACPEWTRAARELHISYGWPIIRKLRRCPPSDPRGANASAPIPPRGRGGRFPQGGHHVTYPHHSASDPSNGWPRKPDRSVSKPYRTATGGREKGGVLMVARSKGKDG